MTATSSTAHDKLISISRCRAHYGLLRGTARLLMPRSDHHHRRGSRVICCPVVDHCLVATTRPRCVVNLIESLQWMYLSDGITFQFVAVLEDIVVARL